MIFPGADAEAQAYGGYTYTSRVCQEYGQQPRWYNVRDGQAAYNGGNSDSGWLIVLERGAGTITYRSDPAGDYAGRDGRFALISDNLHYFSGGVFTPVSGPPNSANRFVRIGESGDYSDFANFVSPSSTIDQNRFSKVSSGGGIYVRWAHMAWCR